MVDEQCLSEWANAMTIKNFLSLLLLFLAVYSNQLSAAPSAAIVLDANTEEVLYERNSDYRLHPAGLTKLITLYATYSALSDVTLSFDDNIKISLKSADEPPVTLGLRAGSEIELRYLVRAVAVLGANDAATAIAEALDVSVLAFLERLEKHSSELGLSKSTWKNAHGLTQIGHFSTAHDIAVLFAKHRSDFRPYFNMFGRLSTSVGKANVASSARRLLQEIDGIEAAKFGYTRAAGFAAAVSVSQPDRDRIVVMIGASTTADLVREINDLINNVN